MAELTTKRRKALPISTFAAHGHPSRARECQITLDLGDEDRPHIGIARMQIDANANRLFRDKKS
ncbi:MAG: hypothetical protein ACRD1G_15565 [Acidimicrobiales bacterium]